jgi:hypothetical protein
MGVRAERPDPIVFTSGALPTIMGEGPVGFRHTVRIFALLHGGDDVLLGG